MKKINFGTVLCLGSIALLEVLADVAIGAKEAPVTYQKTLPALPSKKLTERQKKEITINSNMPHEKRQESLEKGITKAKQNQLTSSLLYQAYKSDREGARESVRRGADVNAQRIINRSGEKRRSPLMEAAERGDTATVQALIEAGADLDAQGSYGETALMMATMYEHLDIVQTLIKAGANVNAQSNYGETALMGAVCSGCLDIAQTLIKAGTNVEARDKYGMTALIYAAYSGYTKMVQALIKGRANIDAQDKNGMTALMLAAMEIRSNVFFSEKAKPTFVALVKAGADHTIVNKDGKTAFDFLLKKAKEYY